jgi:hypothetical protein
MVTIFGGQFANWTPNRMQKKSRRYLSYLLQGAAGCTLVTDRKTDKGMAYASRTTSGRPTIIP